MRCRQLALRCSMFSASLENCSESRATDVIAFISGTRGEAHTGGRRLLRETQAAQQLERECRVSLGLSRRCWRRLNPKPRLFSTGWMTRLRNCWRKRRHTKPRSACWPRRSQQSPSSAQPSEPARSLPHSLSLQQRLEDLQLPFKAEKTVHEDTRASLITALENKAKTSSTRRVVTKPVKPPAPG